MHYGKTYILETIAHYIVASFVFSK